MLKLRKYCLACDLKDDPQLIEEYKKYHAKGNTWAEINQSILDAGVESMEIYLVGNRLFMIMEVNENYTPERKAQMDLENETVQKWEKLMWKYQKQLPWAAEGQKWMPMDLIFNLKNSTD